MNNLRIVDVINQKISDYGLKQKTIARKMNITEDRLSRILSKKSNMLADELLMLCYILNIDINDFRKTDIINH